MTNVYKFPQRVNPTHHSNNTNNKREATFNDIRAKRIDDIEYNFSKCLSDAEKAIKGK